MSRYASVSVEAPRVTKAGARCSGVGAARRSWGSSAASRTAPAMSRARMRSMRRDSTSMAHGATGASGSFHASCRKLWTSPPLPTTQTPSARSGRRWAPSCTICCHPSSAGSDELHHRDVGLGEEEAERNPRAVVEPAGGVEPRLAAAVPEQACDTRRELRAARSSVAELVQRRVEAAEVVHRLGVSEEVRVMPPPVWKCAETTSRALGLGASTAKAWSAGPKSPRSRAICGEPWEMNSAGASMIGER